MAGVGHEERLALPKLNGRCGFGYRAFAVWQRWVV
jgi:hypothetical protein